MNNFKELQDDEWVKECNGLTCLTCKAIISEDRLGKFNYCETCQAEVDFFNLSDSGSAVPGVEFAEIKAVLTSKPKPKAPTFSKPKTLSPEEREYYRQAVAKKIGK